MLKPYSYLLILILCCCSSLAQQQSKRASKFFNKGLYDDALTQYLLLDINILSDNDNLRIGTCCFISNKNIEIGIKHLENYIFNSDSIIPVSYFYLGSLLHKNYQFNEAIQNLQNFLQKLDSELSNGNIDNKTHSQFKKEAEALISYCNYGKPMLKSPRNVLVENLGENINSEYQEYAPAISLDEKVLIFTSRRPENNANKKPKDDNYFEKIFSSELLKGSILEISKTKSESGFFNLKTDFEYSSPIKLPEIINGDNHNASIQISNDGQKLYFYRDSDVWTTIKEESAWTEPQKLTDFSTDFFEPSVYITLDEKMMYITSEKEGGFGKLDIYVSTKDSNGNWSVMENLGSKINTLGDEDISYVSPDNQTIYFSSKGHSSMGGYDIFKSIKKNGEWSSPINMGSPVNTPYDDAFFIMTPKYNRGYYSSDRGEGKGGMDLYRLTFTDERNPLAELAGLVLIGDSMVPAKSKITMIELGDSVSSVQKSRESTGEYLLLVEHGKKYEMYVETEGFAPYKKVFEIPEQMEYFQLYQEIHHVYLKDSKGNIIGQEIITHNAFNNIEKEIRNDTLKEVQNDTLKEVKNDTLKQYFTKEIYSEFVRDTSNSSVQSFVDVKFYINEDSLISLLNNDTTLKLIFPDITEISFLYNEDPDFRLAINSYVESKKITLDYLKDKTILQNKIDTKEELTDSIAELASIKAMESVIFFDFNKSHIQSSAKIKLKLLCDFMQKYPSINFLIKGHSDSKGTDNYNNNLSLKRAKQVYTYVLSKGISSHRLKFKGYGSSKPTGTSNVLINRKDNVTERELDRRVEFELIK